MTTLDTLENLSAALDAVSSVLSGLESGELELSLGVARTSRALRATLVAANGVSAVQASSAPHLDGIQRIRVALEVGAIRAGIQSAAITFATVTDRPGEGLLSRTVAATSAVRTILEVAEVAVRSLQEDLRPDGRNLERDWARNA